MHFMRQRTFYELAKIKSFTKTAEKLNMTQPAVSQHIKYLEEFYGVTLIEKEGRKIFLTCEGELLYEHIKKICAMEKHIKHALKNESSIPKRFFLGATKTIGGYLIPNILGKYKAKYPNEEVILEVANTQEILKKLDEGELDVALIEGLFDTQKYDYELIKKDELVVAFSTKHRFKNQQNLTLKEVLKENLIIREKGSGTRKIIENYLSQKGYESYPIFMEIGDITAIQSLVACDLGYTIISKEAIKEKMDQGKIMITELEDFSLKRDFRLVWRKEQETPFINRFMLFCKEMIESECINNIY